jgi:hypothetical protein
MKLIAITLGALATFVAAQDVPSLPECGQFCANDMLTGQAPGLGCSANDMTCICQNRNFIYGLRDCSAATCGPEDARRIVDFGIALCRDNGVEITTGSGGEITTPTGTDGGEDATATPSGSLSTIFTTISSGDSVITTPIATTIIGGGSDETTGTDESTDASETTGTEDASETPGATTTDASGLISTVTSEDTTFVTTLTTDDSETIVSTITSEDTTLVTTITTSTEEETTTETTTETDGSDGSETTTDEGGAAMPQRTMAPAGILAAGLAVLLF